MTNPHPGTHDLRNRFTTESIATASPARVVTMAYDRLDRDLAGATAAIEAGDMAQTNSLLCHAQDLVNELHLMLDLDAWEHAPALASIYRFVGELLTRANIHKNAADVTTARALLADLGAAFKEAAVIAHAGPSVSGGEPSGATTSSTSAISPPAATGRVWIQA